MPQTKAANDHDHDDCNDTVEQGFEQNFRDVLTGLYVGKADKDQDGGNEDVLKQ